MNTHATSWKSLTTRPSPASYLLLLNQIKLSASTCQFRYDRARKSPSAFAFLLPSLSWCPRFPGALAFLVPSLSWCPRFPGALAFLLPSLPPVLIGDGGGEPAGGPLLSSIACAVKFLVPLEEERDTR
jgi:hypothetical protein